MAGVELHADRAGDATAYTVPTDAAEADGTLAWDSTGMVLVTITAVTEVE